MHTKIIEKAKECEYPCLKQIKGRPECVVGFSSYMCGTVLGKDERWAFPLMQYSTNWVDEDFEIFTGVLQLSNQPI